MELIVKKNCIVKVTNKKSTHKGCLGIADGSFIDVGDCKLWRIIMANGDVARFDRDSIKIISKKNNKALKKRVKFLEKLFWVFYEKI